MGQGRPESLHAGVEAPGAVVARGSAMRAARGGRVAVAAAFALPAALAACTPTLDWRELRPAGSGLVAMFPCKPSVATRDVVLAGRPLRLTLQACSAGEQTWGLGFGDVGDPARLGDALAALRAAAARNLGGVAGAELPLRVAGATPHAASGRVRLEGQAPDGQPRVGQVAVFARGTVVFQATVLGAAIDADAADTFFGGLRAE